MTIASSELFGWTEYSAKVLQRVSIVGMVLQLVAVFTVVSRGKPSPETFLTLLTAVFVCLALFVLGGGVRAIVHVARQQNKS